jgi:opacity protein-like surface antigen
MLMRALPTNSRQILWLGVLFLAAAAVTVPAKAQSQEPGQNQELTFSIGGIPGQTRSFQGSAGATQISADRSFGINYGYRFAGTKIAALFGEIEFAAIPNRALTAASATVPQNYASLYLTPGVRLKFLPGSRVSPWAAIGGGYGLYQQSTQLSNGQNTTNKFLNRGVFEYGGGLDYRLFRFIGLRGEVRDFFSGNPNLNAPLNSNTQHNVVASGGIILRF